MRISTAVVDKGLIDKRTCSGAVPSEGHVVSTKDEGQRALQIAYAACSDAKGKEVVGLDVSGNFGLADYFLVASGRSDRHVQGIANRVIEALESKGIVPYSVQGLEEGQWVVIDCIELVVHLFYEPLRERYDLENLWLNAETVPQDTMTRRMRSR